MPHQDFDMEASMFDTNVEGNVDPTTASDLGDTSELAELRRLLAEAEPRLEAFAALEALAEEQGTTPEAVAIKASIEVIEAEQGDAEAELQRLRAEHYELLQEHAAVGDEVVEMLDELEAIRSDAVRLLGEKAELELKVEALRNGLASDTESIASGKGRGTVIDTDPDDEEATAFDRFFDADVEEDKARAWMLE